MTDCRWFHTASLLLNGNILISGGYAGEPEHLGNVRYILKQAEVYEVSTGYWIPTSSMNLERFFHTATVLRNGKVLVVGGNDDEPKSAELYDPPTETWTNTENMHYGRKWHTATILKNGKVLVTGGDDTESNVINNAEVFDPSTETWKVVDSMHYQRCLHTATLLNNGKVLVTGGMDSDQNVLSSTELFDRSTESWTITGNMSYSRYTHTASLLPNRKVLLSGGGGGPDPHSDFSNSSELYDISTGVWTITSTMNHPRGSHTATVLKDGNILVIGGNDVDHAAQITPEIYNSSMNTYLLIYQ